ncbi:nuclear transport factor 2 family protein [Roseicyclus sp.]|uniref:nuclear transport factor 2 family protein n=1 Tax=Roseicyclus sp. TaxID=1914329 RepID=UPI003F6AA429
MSGRIDPKDGLLNPLAIYQAQIDAVGRAFWKRDWTRLMTLLALPTQLRTTDARITLTGHDEALQMMQELRDDMDRMNVSEYHRIATDAQLVDAESRIIAGQHITHIMRGGSHARAPYTSRQFIRFEDGLWKCYDLDCEVQNRDLAVVGPKTARARRDLPVNADAASRIYQDWIDRCDAAFWAEDHARLGAMMAYPHRINMLDDDRHFDGPSDLIASAMGFRAHLRQSGVKQFYRVCTQARLLADGMAIEGAHLTHIRTGQAYLLAPYVTRMTLVLRNGNWLCGRLDATTTQRDIPLLNPPGPASDRHDPATVGT